MKVKINADVLKEFEYMIELHKQHGATSEFESVEQLIGFILSSVADGSRRPGAWERQMLDSMGLIADCEEHNIYRQTYGSPE